MPEVTPVAATELSVPEGIVKARAAFLRDFPKLMADRKTRGKYVCYHNGELVAVVKDYSAMLVEVYRRKMPDNEWLIFKVTEESKRWEELVAVEGDLEDY